MLSEFPPARDRGVDDRTGVPEVADRHSDAVRDLVAGDDRVPVGVAVGGVDGDVGGRDIAARHPSASMAATTAAVVASSSASGGGRAVSPVTVHVGRQVELVRGADGLPLPWTVRRASPPAQLPPGAGRRAGRERDRHGQRGGGQDDRPSDGHVRPPEPPTLPAARTRRTATPSTIGPPLSPTSQTNGDHGRPLDRPAHATRPARAPPVGGGGERVATGGQQPEIGHAPAVATDTDPDTPAARRARPARRASRPRVQVTPVRRGSETTTLRPPESAKDRCLAPPPRTRPRRPCGRRGGAGVRQVATWPAQPSGPTADRDLNASRGPRPAVPERQARRGGPPVPGTTMPRARRAPPLPRSPRPASGAGPGGPGGGPKGGEPGRRRRRLERVREGGPEPPVELSLGHGHPRSLGDGSANRSGQGHPGPGEL